jgi:hypothetical protein
MIDKYSLNQKNEYNSQEELRIYLKELVTYLKSNDINQNIYGMVYLSTLGNNNCYYEGFTIQKIFNLIHFEEKIKKKVELWFNNENEKKIYYSNNNFSIIYKNDILSSLKFKQLSQSEFDTLQKIFGGSTDQIKFGFYKEFLDYEFPTKEEIVDFIAKKLKSLLKPIIYDENSPLEEFLDYKFSTKEELIEFITKKLKSLLKPVIYDKNF